MCKIFKQLESGIGYHIMFSLLRKLGYNVNEEEMAMLNINFDSDIIVKNVKETSLKYERFLSAYTQYIKTVEAGKELDKYEKDELYKASQRVYQMSEEMNEAFRYYNHNLRTFLEDYLDVTLPKVAVEVPKNPANGRVGEPSKEVDNDKLIEQAKEKASETLDDVRSHLIQMENDEVWNDKIGYKFYEGASDAIRRSAGCLDNVDNIVMRHEVRENSADKEVTRRG